MEKTAIKDFLYGGIIELMNNPAYCYHSPVHARYNRWSDQGQAALHEFIELVSLKMHEAEQVELNQRAKQLVVQGLSNNQPE